MRELLSLIFLIMTFEAYAIEPEHDFKLCFSGYHRKCHALVTTQEGKAKQKYFADTFLGASRIKHSELSEADFKKYRTGLVAAFEKLQKRKDRKDCIANVELVESDTKGQSNTYDACYTKKDGVILTDWIESLPTDQAK